MKENMQPLVIQEAEEVEEVDQTKPQNLESYIRDSVFGDDFRSYDQKLQNLTQQLERTQHSITEIQNSLLAEIAEVKAQYEDIPDNITQRVDNRIDEHISRSENDLEKLSTLINEFATDFQAKIDRLHTEMNNLEDYATTQIGQRTEKIGRNRLADALIAIGTQLKEEL